MGRPRKNKTSRNTYSDGGAPPPSSVHVQPSFGAMDTMPSHPQHSSDMLWVAVGIVFLVFTGAAAFMLYLHSEEPGPDGGIISRYRNVISDETFEDYRSIFVTLIFVGFAMALISLKWGMYSAIRSYKSVSWLYNRNKAFIKDASINIYDEKEEFNKHLGEINLEKLYPIIGKDDKLQFAETLARINYVRYQYNSLLKRSEKLQLSINNEVDENKKKDMTQKLKTENDDAVAALKQRLKSHLDIIGDIVMNAHYIISNKDLLSTQTNQAWRIAQQKAALTK